MKKLIVYFRAPEEFISHLSDISNQFKIIICKNRDELESHLPETVILIRIQALTAGVDFFPLNEIKKQDIILTNGRGIHKIYIAEYAIAAMINLARNFHLMFRNQLKGKWDRSVPQDEIHGCTVGILVHGCTVGILGLGSIGQEIAHKASILGMRIIGVKYNPCPLEGVDHAYGPTEMEEVFKQSDYVINLLPDTRLNKVIMSLIYCRILQLPGG
jgi:phosphoglycerate dehydrogenase-like enzyme